MSQEHDIKVLNGLIEATIDSAEGYDEAAKDAQSAQYTGTFQSRAGERRQVARSLQQAVSSLGGKADTDGSMLASAHRAFVNLRKSLSKGDTAVVSEVERGEDHIKHKFENALKDADLTTQTRTLIEEAYISVKAGHDQMRDLKHAIHRP
jgi:uncharacterized protein (TIGR02284 family)